MDGEMSDVRVYDISTDGWIKGRQPVLDQIVLTAARLLTYSERRRRGDVGAMPPEVFHLLREAASPSAGTYYALEYAARALWCSTVSRA